ncbi:hypothetical protein GQ600_25282 [Phytophthora cactorum]|nr:hypothetical protein GQ600_25282 [Phytophthora cactorum]
MTTVDEVKLEDIRIGTPESVSRKMSNKRTTTATEADWEDLITLNRLLELLLPKDEEPIVRVVAVTRSRTRRKDPPELLKSDVVQRMRPERIQQAQDEEKWIAHARSWLLGLLDFVSLRRPRNMLGCTTCRLRVLVSWLIRQFDLCLCGLFIDDVHFFGVRQLRNLVDYGRLTAWAL